MEPNTVTIEILNWAKHNPKRDQKTYTWLRLDNNIISDPDLFGLSAEQKLVFIEILCQASRKNCATVTLNIGHLVHVTGVKEEKIFGLLKFLQAKPIISVHDNARSPDVVSTTPTYVRTNERTQERTNGIVEVSQHDTNEKTARSRLPSFDFEVLYKKYPRKLGKASGMQRLAKMVKTPEDYQALDQAIQNYAKHCAQKGTEEKFIKHFDSFVGTVDKQHWRDWVDYQFTPLEKPKRDYSFLLEGDAP